MTKNVAKRVRSEDLAAEHPRAPRRRLNLRAQIRAAAVVLLHDRPQGARFTELVDTLNRKYPERSAKAIGNDIVGLDKALATQVVRPAKGLYLHTRFASPGRPTEERTEPVAPPIAHPRRKSTSRRVAAEISEQDFYAPFATWLRNDLEEVTHAIPLGGNLFKGRWGTPDVLGKYESKRSDVVKGPIVIVAGEMKTDLSELFVGFGQACVYRLFAHKSFLAVPKQTPPEDLDRLEALCHMHSVGLVTFDAESPVRPGFRLLVRAVKHEPVLSYTNRYLRSVEAKLFA